MSGVFPKVVVPRSGKVGKRSLPGRPGLGQWRETQADVGSHRDRVRKPADRSAGVRAGAAPAADFVVELRGLAIVDVDADGKTHVDTPKRIIGSSATAGALFGLLLGLLFFVPGMVLLGGAIGALMGVFNKSGVDAQFRNRVEHLLEPGHSAVVIMASKITEDKFATAMQPFGGTILKSLRLDECTLPEQGWGVLEFSEISSAAGRDWTDDGQVHEASTPKGGPPNAIRRVPIPPALVTSEG